MSDKAPMRPWRESDEKDRAAEVVRLVAGIAPRPVDVGKGWDDVIERVARPKSSRLMWFAAAAAAVLLAWVSLQWPFGSASRPAPTPAPVVAAKAAECEEPQMCVEGSAPAAPSVAPAPVVAPKKQQAPKVAVVVEEAPAPPEEEAPAPAQGPKDVVVASGAIWSQPGDDALKLDRGSVEVKPHAETFTVTTPEVTLASTTARYAADVTEAGTVVRVFEGELAVIASASRQAVTLVAGEERTFSAAPAPSALDVVPPAVSSPACARFSVEQRVACLTNEARGDGLRAQAALYEAAYLQVRAGRAAAAELSLRESLRRFPSGVLHPEVRLSLIKALTAQRRLSEAGDVGRDFLTACPDDPRAADVEAFLRTLEWLESR